MVVHDIGKVVCRQFVGPLPEHLVVKGIGIHLDVSADQVVHLHDDILRHPEPYGPCVGRLEKIPDLILRQGEGVAELHPRLLVVDEGAACGLRRSPLRLKFLRRVESIVGIAVGNELVGIAAVDALALGLPVWGVRMLLRGHLDDIAILVNALVRMDAAPVKGLDYVSFGARHEPVGVGILNADDEVTTVLLGIQIVIESRPDSSHMERACRRRRKSYSCSSFHNDMSVSARQNYYVSFYYARIPPGKNITQPACCASLTYGWPPCWSDR